MISITAVMRSLRKSIPHLPEATHHAILAQLAVDKLAGDVPDDGAPGLHASDSGYRRFGTLSANAAAEPSDFHATEVTQILREIHNLGWSGDVPTDKPISVYELDSKLPTSRDDDTILRKMALKTRMARVGMLP